MKFDLTIDAHHPARLARFWEAALPSYAIRPYDDQEIARLASLGHTPQTDPCIALDPLPGNDGPVLFFQQSDMPATDRNRLHIDLKAANPQEEIERLLGLDVSIRDRHADHIVMLDPEGNQFCVFGIPQDSGAAANKV